MKFLDLKDIAEQFMEIANPTSAEKIIRAGEITGLKHGHRVIDFGCGYGTTLMLWAERFRILGVGVDIRPKACERAVKKIGERGLASRLEIACGDASKFTYPPESFDVAACIGATFIWGKFGEAVHAMKRAIRPGGKLVVGEAYWQVDDVPEEFRKSQPEITSEQELLQAARSEGFEFEYVLHSSLDEWDRYEAGNWHGLLRWIEEHPGHPERQQVIDHLHESQDEYVQYGRLYFGWAIYVLNPAG